MEKNKETMAKAPPLAPDTQQLLEWVYGMLTLPTAPTTQNLPPALLQQEPFAALQANLKDLREISASLGRGELQNLVTSKGIVLAGLKGLQSNLRHLTWQTKMVAKGDFSQQVDFLGEFSDAFNEMTHKLQRYQQQMQHLASYDALTQIPNRLSLEQFGADAFKKAQSSEAPLSALMMDIDHFKLVNDTYGHAIGDTVLVTLAELLREQLRISDFVARYGGEEFVAILPNTPLAAALQTAQRICAAVRKLKVKTDNGTTFGITISIGVGQIIPQDKAYTDIIERSDQALYLAKMSGRNRVCQIADGNNL
ncbi:GGDEF domain-containing protein [Ruminococcaceae bacterium OttesenSCG-928-A16]|nr:GGDEF domain-containing protein [Ruminococcaceae bacterium OttesenSCG-928-A16]